MNSPQGMEICHSRNSRNSRQTADRREFTWRTFIFGYLRSRRRAQRRGTETEAIFSDWHHPWLFFLATGTMLMSCVDAIFTLRLLARGAIEVNPIMAIALDHGTLAFTASKLALTGLGILLLVYLSRMRLFNRIRLGLVLTLFFSVYACLVCYQFILMIQPR